MLVHSSALAVSAMFLCACAAPQRQTVTLASHCEVNHTVRDNDSVESRISRMDDGWMVSLTLHMHLTTDTPAIEIRGIGHVAGPAGHRVCEVTEANGTPGQPRFDADLCLDELESLADVLDDAEQTARPGETVVQEVRLRPSRRHRARSHVSRISAFQERAEITRDPQGRVVRVVRSTQQGGQEDLQVSYPSGVEGRCLPQD